MYNFAVHLELTQHYKGKRRELCKIRLDFLPPTFLMGMKLEPRGSLHSACTGHLQIHSPLWPWLASLNGHGIRLPCLLAPG